MRKRTACITCLMVGLIVGWTVSRMVGGNRAEIQPVPPRPTAEHAEEPVAGAPSERLEPDDTEEPKPEEGIAIRVEDAEADTASLCIRVRTGAGAPKPEVDIRCTSPGQDAENALVGRSDLDGEVLFEGLAEGRRRVVLTYRSGFTVVDAPVLMGKRTIVDVRIDEGPAAIEGRVIDTDGRPVTGARVMIRSGPMGKESISEVITDNGGGFRFEGVKAGWFSLGAWVIRDGKRFASRRKVVVPEGEPGTIRLDDIVLGKPGIRGRVISKTTGAPLEGVEVYAIGHYTHAVSDREGRFEFGSLPEKEWVLLGKKAGFGRCVIGPVAVMPDTTTECQLEMGEAVDLVLNVQDSHGGTCTTELSLQYLEDREGAAWGFLTLEAADDRRYHCDDLSAGEYTLRVVVHGVGKAEFRSRLVPGENELPVTVEAK